MDTVKDVAESLGLIDLNEDTARNLAMDVEYRIHEILEQGVKFMRHSKRKTLTTHDIEKALRVLNIEPLYGYDSSKPLVFKEALIGSGQTLYYIDDQEIDFEKLINQPLPKVPRATTFTAHWLAIEGVQPLIPQNPLMSEIKSLNSIQRGAITNVLTNSTDSIAQSNGGSNSNNGSSNHHNGASNNPNIPTTNVSTQSKDLEIKPLVKHVLSKELQLYFDKVVSALLTADLTNDESIHLKQAALSSLKTDPGLHQLVPYFIQFISEQITHNLNNIEILSTMLELIYSLLSNPNIFLDPYIHALMPCILTLLLAKKIGNSQSPTNDEHFAVRDFASSLLDHVCNNFGKSYKTLKPRVTRTLLKAFLDANKPIGTQYGSIIGLRTMGNEVIRIIILGNLSNWSNSVLSSFNEDEQKLLIKTIVNCLRKLSSDVSSTISNSEIDKEKLISKCGEQIAEQISLEDDSVQLYNAIFFADLSSYE